MATPDTSPTLCIGVLTLNEARRIEACVKSAGFADQIVVMDSGSTDETVAIAKTHGAHVVVEPHWKGFAHQRNLLLERCTTDYIFFLDADEVITPELEGEIRAALLQDAPAVWETHWLEIAFGKKMTQLASRKSLPRLFPRAQLVSFSGVVHESATLTDPALPRHKFQAPLLHYSRETVHDSLKKLTQYSMLGAAKRQKKGRSGGVFRGVLSGGWMFIRLYFFKRAFLAGGPGFLYSLFIALEFFFRQAALRYDRASLRNDIRR